MENLDLLIESIRHSTDNQSKEIISENIPLFERTYQNLYGLTHKSNTLDLLKKLAAGDLVSQEIAVESKKEHEKHIRELETGRKPTEDKKEKEKAVSRKSSTASIIASSSTASLPNAGLAPVVVLPAPTTVASAPSARPSVVTAPVTVVLAPPAANTVPLRQLSLRQLSFRQNLSPHNLPVFHRVNR